MLNFLQTMFPPLVYVLKCELSSSILSADAGNWLRVMTDIIHKWNELINMEDYTATIAMRVSLSYSIYHLLITHNNMAQHTLPYMYSEWLIYLHFFLSPMVLVVTENALLACKIRKSTTYYIVIVVLLNSQMSTF